MKRLTLVAALLSLDMMIAFGAVTISAPPSEVRMGSFPQFSFTISGVTNAGLAARAVPGNPYSWWTYIDYVLVDENGLTVGDVMPDQESLCLDTNGVFRGSFSWGMSRIMDPNWFLMYASPGRYKIQVHILEDSEGNATFMAETPSFDLVGCIPSLILRSYPDGKTWLYCSGEPGGTYTLSSTSDLCHWSEDQTFQIPSEGIHAINIGSPYGYYEQSRFYRLTKVDYGD